MSPNLSLSYLRGSERAEYANSYERCSLSYLRGSEQTFTLEDYEKSL